MTVSLLMAGDRTGALARRFPRRAWMKGAAGLVALLVVAACENGGLGVFHTLATESERRNRNLDDNLTVGGVARAAGRYYVAAGGMWRRPTGGGNWEAVERPASDDEPMLVLSLAAIGDTLCAATTEGVRYAPAARSPRWTKADGITAQVLRVFSVPGSEGEILAITQEHEVYRSTDCASFTKVGLPSGASGRPFDALRHDGTYWLTIGDQVYSGAGLDSLTRERKAPEEGAYRGIWCAPGASRCYFANKNGGIYRRDDTGWHKRTIESPDDDDPTVRFTLFVRIDDEVLVGTEGFGFYRFDATDVEPSVIVRGPRSTSQLYQAHVTLFADFGSIVFAGTARKGLSSITVENARKDTGTWDWE